MRSEEKFNKILEALNALETLARLEKELKEEKEKKEEVHEEKPDMSEVFSKECSVTVKNKSDDDNRSSETCVEFDNCKTLADQTVLAVSLLSAIIEDMDKKDAVDYLAKVSTIVIAGEHAGVFKTREELEERKKEEE